MTRKKLLILTLSFCLLDTLAPLAATPEIRILQRRAAQDAAVVLPADASTILRYTVSDFNEDCRESAGRTTARRHNAQGSGFASGHTACRHREKPAARPADRREAHRRRLDPGRMGKFRHHPRRPAFRRLPRDPRSADRSRKRRTRGDVRTLRGERTPAGHRSPEILDRRRAAQGQKRPLGPRYGRTGTPDLQIPRLGSSTTNTPCWAGTTAKERTIRSRPKTGPRFSKRSAACAAISIR